MVYLLKYLIRYGLIYMGMFLSINSYAQDTIQLSGKISDTVGTGLSSANIICFSIDQKVAPTKFSIANSLGEYNLSLIKNARYRLEVSYVGFRKHIEIVSISKNSSKSFELLPNTEMLDEVLITEKSGVTIKKDTIIFNADTFANGKERKLKGILEKLPGIEVDKSGNVTVNGKSVTRLLVEGKKFFTGDEKLGVNNIPADAVESIEAIEDFHEVSFLKGLTKSEELALNIKLKEGKKDFIFGSINGGGGIKNRYVLNPSVFYYSSKTAINAIGDFNNYGKKSFTLKDYIDFEGGITKLLENPSSFNLFNDDFAKFLRGSDLVFDKNEFSAVNISKQLSGAWNFNGYGIVNQNRSESLETNDLIYLTQNNQQEERRFEEKRKLSFMLAKIKLRNQPSINTDMSFDSFFKASRGRSDEQNTSVINNETALNSKRSKPSNIFLKQSFEYNHLFKSNNAMILNGNYSFEESREASNLISDRILFPNILMITEPESSLELLQNISTKTHKAHLENKYFHVLNSLHHINPIVGFDFLYQNYETFDGQIGIDDTINSFEDKGFNNKASYRWMDSYMGLEYRFKIGVFTVNPTLKYHFYNWQINQDNQQGLKKIKPQLLPRLEIDMDLKRFEKLSFKSGVESRFTNIRSFANRFVFDNFNQISRGDNGLENDLNYFANLNYRKTNLLKGFFLDLNFRYRHNFNSFRNRTIIDGIEQINQIVLTNLPENSYHLSGSLSKKIKKIKFGVNSSLLVTNYSRILNDEIVDYNNENYAFKIYALTKFKKYPNIELGVSSRFSSFQSDIFTNHFILYDPYVELKYDFFTDFSLITDYTYNYYENRTNNEINRFGLGNLTLKYQKENKPIGFSLEVNNLFDVLSKNRNSFSQFLITDSIRFIQARTILFKTSYFF